jgi:hypothetical protein
VWRLKYLIYGMIPSAVIGVALYFLAPAMADTLRDSVRDSASHAVEREFLREVPDTVEPGQIVITERQIEDAIENADDVSRWDIGGDVTVTIEDGRISILAEDRGRPEDTETIASGEPVIQDGEFRIINRKGILSIFKAARDAIGDEVERQMAALFDRSNVRPVSVTAKDGRLLIVTESMAGGETTPATIGTTPTPQATRTGGLTGTPLRTPTPTP